MAGIDSFNDCIDAINKESGRTTKAQIHSLSDDGRIFAFSDVDGIDLYTEKGMTIISKTGACTSHKAQDSSHALVSFASPPAGGMMSAYPGVGVGENKKVYDVCSKNPTLKKLMNSSPYSSPTTYSAKPNDGSF